MQSWKECLYLKKHHLIFGATAILTNINAPWIQTRPLCAHALIKVSIKDTFHFLFIHSNYVVSRKVFSYGRVFLFFLFPFVRLRELTI
jgi:hypothetical protein